MIGNRCGHNPDDPCWFKPPEKHALRPKILIRLIEIIRQYYQKPVETLPLLNAVNESDRQQRSERREACVAILGCILHYTDLVTLRVGIPQADGSMMGLTVPYLAELSGLNERRAERAIRDLKAAGIITVHPLCEKLNDTTYKGYAAIRTVTKYLFVAFGLGAWLQHEQRKAQERKNKREAKKHKKTQANIQMALNAQRDVKTNTQQESQRANKMTNALAFLANIQAMLKDSTDPPAVPS